MKLFSKAKDLFDGGKMEDLLYHVRSGNLDYIKTVAQKLLLKARDDDGNTVLLIATNKGNLNLCKEILEKCPSLLYHANSCSGNTVLHQATDFLLIDFFVSVGLNEITTSNEEDRYMKFKNWMKMQNLKGNTALLDAVRYRNLHVVQRFVEVDRQYNLGLSKVIGFESKTAFKWARENEDLEMVKLLVDEGDPYSDYVPYLTAMDLFDRVRRGDIDYIKTVDLNVLLNSRDQDRMSVLCIATRCDQLDCCKEILRRCPSLLYHQNNQKMTVLHHAADYGLRIYRLVDFFVRVGLEAAAKSEGGPENMIRFKTWINLLTSYGDTALISAVISHNHDIVERLAVVDRQYKLGLSEIVGRDNKTALQWAMFYKYHEMIKLLIGSGDPCLDYDANTNSNIPTSIANTNDNIPISIDMQQAQEPLQTGYRTGVSNKRKIFTFEEVSKHNKLKDCWLLINNKVYDVTIFLRVHPGGSEVLSKAAGKDASTDFNQVHRHSSNAVTMMMDKFYVGECDSIATSLSKLASEKPQLYAFFELKKYTKGFSEPLGSGGFGDVYKGRLQNGVFIAVKVLKNIESKEKVMEEQFVAEVDTMGRAYHRNLIKLYGYCYEANTKFKALVYEYMENGSFDTILFEKKLDIPWAKLYNIAKEIAQGISYLHESCSPQIIHQDIKPSNVLLDSNLSPKVIDFGLAKVNRGESQFEQTKIKGSRDYMAPEVNQPEQVKLSCKLDVYSFGKMLFDILGSKRNRANKSRFPGQVWEKYKTNQLDKFILDSGIKEEDKESAKRLAIIALLCVEHNPRARPMLSSVVKMIEGKIKLDIPVAPFYPNYYSSESSLMNDSRDY